MFKSKYKYQVCLLVSIFCFSLPGAFCQGEIYKPKKRAKKTFDLAVQAYIQKDEPLALDYALQSIKKDSLYFEAWMLHAQLSERQRDYQSAANSMTTAMKIRPNARTKYGETWCRILHRSGQYAEAVQVLNSLVKSDELDRDFQLLEASVRFSAEAILHPKPVNAELLKGNVNTDYAEYYPSIFISGDRMIFTRQMVDNGRFQGQEDFFGANKVNGNWIESGPIQGVNTSGNEGAPSVRGDGRRLVFTACETLGNGYGLREGKGSCDLFEAEWNPATQRYDQGQNLAILNTSFWESQPCLSADGNQIYFVRAKRNQEGLTVQNIYHSTRNESGEWNAARRLPSTINTIGKEENPVLHPDGKTLYFSSDGHPGLGGLDLFVSRMDSLGSWTTPVNLGFPVNSNADENSLQVFPDGKKALFASDREESGNLDLYEFDLPLVAQANPVFDWSGRVFDASTGDPVKAEVLVYDDNGLLLCTMNSDEMDGMFSLPIVERKALTLEVNHPNYLFYHENLRIDNQDFNGSSPAHALEIPLSQLEIGTVLLLRDVQFETNSAVLDEVFQPELDQLVATMAASNIRIRIIGHTDNSGTKTFNQALSENRASSVADFLLQNGIKQSRMETSGRGADSPIASNDSETGRSSNRRTEIVIVE